MLDIFTNDAFSVVSLTDMINRAPYLPGRAGTVIDWNEQGVTQLSVLVEEFGNELRLVNPTPRGGPGETMEKPGRTMRALVIPHYEIDDSVYADEVQGIRAFGSETILETVQGKVQQRLNMAAQLRLDPTLEYHRVGALRGIIVNRDGSVLYNLFNEFGITQPETIAFDFDNVTGTGRIRRLGDQANRAVMRRLGGVGYSGLYAFVGDDFWDALVNHIEVRETYLGQAEASDLRNGTVYSVFNYGGITWENYRGGIGGVDGAEHTPFIPPNEAQFFPTGVPGLFRTVYGPADYIETVNTVGLPRYAKQFRMPNDKGIYLETQMNALSYCTRPTALVRGVMGATL